MDALSEILKSMKLRHVALGTMHLGSGWGLSVSNFDAPTAYGLAEGPACWIRVGGRAPQLLAQGDLALFPRGRSYAMSCGPDTPCDDLGVAWAANGLPAFSPDSEPAVPLRFVWGGPGPATRLLSMAFGMAGGRSNPLLAALPDVIILRHERNGTFPWLRPSLDFLSTQEAGSPGFAATARLLVELVFVSIVRSHLIDEPRATRGWLRGLTDRQVGLALQAMHAAPGADWTLATLAKKAGLSRTALATRFGALVETTPIQYLTDWRMHLAAVSILQERPHLGQLAYELGYTSDAAFRDAFKRRYGVPPSRYAQAAQQPAT